MLLIFRLALVARIGKGSGLVVIVNENIEIVNDGFVVTFTETSKIETLYLFTFCIAEELTEFIIIT